VENEEYSQRPEVFVKSITFNDKNTFEFNKSDTVVFTGTNNSGKSQVLKEIYHSFYPRNTTLSAPPKIVIKIDNNFLGNIDLLISNTKRNSKGEYLIGNSYFAKNYIHNCWNTRQLNVICEYFINYLNTEKRLSSSNSPDSFDSISVHPQHPIQYLYVDDEKEKELSRYFCSAFGMELIVDRGAGNKIPLFVGNKPKFNEGEDRVSTSYRERLTQLPRLQEQGDGMRSFAGILLDTFTSQHSVTLIDEPEAFLHPPQARLLGEMLAKNTKHRQLFVSTHSEDFIKGLLDTNNENVKIIRINRDENINKMNILKNDDIKHLWNDSILRYSNILSGLFHSKVVICESDNDCRFYQAIKDALDNEKINSDILFTHSGGKQRLKTVIKALKALNVKIVTIADIDVLNDKNTFKDITDSLNINWETIDSSWNTIDDYVKTQVSGLNSDNIKKKIRKIVDKIPEDECSFPQKSVNEIKKVLKSLTVWSKIKETGKAFFKGKEEYKAFNEIDNICKQKGLFIVPVGELEQFYKGSASHGTKWINEVLETTDLKNDSKLKAAREFVEEIIKY
jgi:predicted ATPase